MTPLDLADLHAAAFAPERGWSVAEFEELIALPNVGLFCAADGFLLVRTIADEAEILTLAVAPNRRRKGVADTLIRNWIATTVAETAFLEVARDNTAARRLYSKHGFVEIGCRKGYYARPGNAPEDAVLMKLAMTRGQTGQSPRSPVKTG